MKKMLFLTLVFVMAFSVMLSAKTVEGVLEEKGDADHFQIYAMKDELEVEFDWDEDLEIWVSIIGETGNHLGYFDMWDGNLITLTGGGSFTIVVISHAGSGNWKAHY